MAKDNTAHSAITFWTPFSTTMPQTTFWINDAHRTLRPGGHLAVVTTPKDYHRVTTAVEDAGFEIRDQIVWLREDFTTNASVVLARKPLEGTVAANVLKWGTGAIHIDANRLSTTDTLNQGSNNRTNSVVNFGMKDTREGEASAEKTYGEAGVTNFTMKPGRRIATPKSDPTKRKGVVGQGFGFTTNDVDKFQEAQRESIERTNTMGRWPTNTVLSGEAAVTEQLPDDGDDSSARFFTTCTDWEQFYAYLVNLVTMPDGTVLDPMGHHDIRSVVDSLGFHYVDGRHKQ